MNLVERLFVLKATAPFDRLRDSELALIAGVAEEHAFAPGAVIHAGTDPFRRLHVLVEGGWHWPDGRAAPRILGVASLLFGHPAAGPVTTDAAARVRCLTISKGHFHTICHECPELVLGFMDMKGAIA